MISLTKVELFQVLRRRMRWSRKSAARRLRVSPRALRSWEEGTRNPSEDALAKIQELLAASTN